MSYFDVKFTQTGERYPSVNFSVQHTVGDKRICRYGMIPKGFEGILEPPMEKSEPANLQVKSLSRSLMRRMLLLSLVGVLGLSLTILLVYLLTLTRARARIDDINHGAVSVVDQFFLITNSDLQAASEGLGAKGDKSQVLLALWKRNQAFQDVFLLSPDRDILFQQNAAGHTKQTKIDQPVWLKSLPPLGEVVIGPVLYEGQTPYVEMAVTVTDDIGLPAGLLLVRVDLTGPWNAVLDIKAGDTGYVYITDSAGQLLAFPGPRSLNHGTAPEEFAGRSPREGSAFSLNTHTGIKGEKVLASARPFKTVPWFAVVELPIKEALRPFTIPAMVLFITLLAIGLLLYNTVWFTRTRIVSPLLGLRDAVRQLADGHLKQSVAVLRNDELGQLGQSFNRMTGQMQQAFIDLKSQVDTLNQAQAAQLESESRFRLLAENSSDMISRHDPQGFYLYVSPACRALLGYEPEELIGHSSFEFVHPDDIPTVDRSRTSIISQPVVSTTVFRARHKNGDYIWMETTSRTVFDEASGKILEIHAASRDVTGRILAENAVSESENLYRKMIENSPLGMHFYKLNDDDQLIFLGANPTADKLLGVDNTTFIGKAIDEAFPALVNTEVPERYRDAAAKGISWSTEQIAYQDDQIVGAFEVSAFQTAPKNMVAVFAEITKRKQAEEALQESTARLETLIQVSPLAIILIDLNGNVQLWNSSAERIFGWTAREVIGRPNPIVPADKLVEYKAWTDQIMLQGKLLSDQEVVRLRKDGSLVDVSLSSAPMYDGAGNIIGRMAIIADISERKQAERMIRTSEEKFSKAFQASPESITIASMEDGRYVEVNDIFLRTTGFHREEVIGHTSTELNVWVGENDRRRFIEELTRRGYLKDFELQYRMRSGEIRDFLVSSESIELAGKRCSLNLISDITERKLAQENIQNQLERLNALRNIDDVIKSSDDLRFTLKVFLGEVSAQLKIDAASVLLFNKNSVTLDYAGGHGFRSNALLHTKLGTGEGYAGRVILERKTLHIPDLTQVDNILTETLALAGENFAAYVGAPLVAKGEIVGVLEIFQRSPLSPDPEWFNFLNMLASQAAIAIDNAQLFESLQRSNFDLTMAYDATIEGWSRALDLRDRETEGHTQRVTTLTVKLARQIGTPDPEIIHMRRGALLHDIGKMGIPDSILLKPGKLTSKDWEIMRQHPVYAYEMLAPIHYLRPALDIPRYHHEKWDGSGYPHGLTGYRIPLAARIFAVIDVWDALTNDRPYRGKWTDEKTEEYIQEQRGKHFDPEIVDAFLQHILPGKS